MVMMAFARPTDEVSIPEMNYFENLKLRFRPQMLGLLADGDSKISDLMRSTRAEFSAHQKLAYSGEPHDCVWRLVKGWCIRWRSDADGQRQIVYLYLPGDLIVLGSMFLSIQYDTFEFLDYSVAEGLGPFSLHAAAQEDYNISLRIMSHFIEENHHIANWILLMSKSSAEKRISTMILDLDVRLAQLGMSDQGTFMLPMTQQDIGDYVGLSAVHVNRVLRRLSEREIARIDRGVVRLLDRPKLVELATPAKVGV